MKRIAPWLALAIALSCGTVAHAQDKEKANVVRDYTDTVAPPDQQAYESGVKSFNQCLSQHGFKYAWTAWTHETGDTYMYSYTSAPGTWADFDAMQAAGKACDQSFRANANPHLKSETSSFLEIMPELSHLAKGAFVASPLIEVTFIKLKPGHDAVEAFTAAAKKISDAAEKSNWSEHYWIGRVRGGGENSPDFILVSPSQSWAEVGQEANPSVWKMLENADGKADAQAVRKSINDAIEGESSHMDSLNKDLTYTPSAK